MKHSAVVTFTARGPETLLLDGGSRAWRLVEEKARAAEFLVCCQNRKRGEWGGASEPHGEAFLVGRISEVVPDYERPDRWHIKISEYARIAVPNAWQGWRYPVHYTTLEDLGIDPTKLTFTPMPPPPEGDAPRHPPATDDEMEVQPLTIAQAKEGLAAYFKVSPDAIKITIEM